MSDDSAAAAAAASALVILNEREGKYDARFRDIEHRIEDAVKANGLALASLDRRFETMNEFRAQLSDQQATFARKSDVDQVMNAVEKASIKSEAATEKRLEGVNEFREQLSDQQATLVRKSEVDIRFESLEKKLDAAVAQLQITKGRDSGWVAAAAVLATVLTLGLSVLGVVLAIVLKK